MLQRAVIGHLVLVSSHKFGLQTAEFQDLSQSPYRRIGHLCFLVVVLGLVATLIILAIVEIPLPALPFSMFAGVTVYFWTQYLVAPWIAELGYSGVLV